MMKKAGARAPSADRITLLRDADGDGVAEVRTPVPEQPALAVRHGAGRRHASTSPIPMRVVRFPYKEGDTADHRAGPKFVADLPGGPINHHWTKNLHGQPRRQEPLRHASAPTATSAENGMDAGS
ncbi:MAG: hypothetical protein QM760_01075 [Nibricoccus sp.]